MSGVACGDLIYDQEGTGMECSRDVGHWVLRGSSHYSATENRSWSYVSGTAQIWNGDGPRARETTTGRPVMRSEV